MKKKVSILLSCYRGSDLIAQYMNHLLTPEIIETCTLIAVNFPFSHRNPAQVEEQLRRYPDLLLLNWAENISLYEAWNVAIHHSKTEYLSNLNLDDRVTPDYYVYGVNSLNVRQADVFSSFSVMTSEIGKRSPDARKQHHIELPRFADKEIIEYGIEDMVVTEGGRIIKRNIPHCAPIWRRSLHERLGFFNSKAYDICADFEFWLRVAGFGMKLVLSKHEKTLFFSAKGTASDRLLHSENVRIIERWAVTFPPPGYKETHLGQAHDRLHHCMNLNVIFSSEKYHSHLVGQERLIEHAHKSKLTLIDEDDNSKKSQTEMRVQISIIMPTFNCARFLREAVDSVLTQGLNDIELVIVDDGSTDGTLERAYEIADTDRRVRVLRNNRKKGVSGARNTGLEAAQGQYISFLDADDAYDPGALSERLHAFEKNKNLPLIHSRVRFVSESGQELGAGVATTKTITYLDMSGNVAHLNSIMGRAEIIRRFRFNEDLENGEDWLFLASILRSGVQSEFVEKGGAIYRIHSSSTVIRNYHRHERNLIGVIDWLYSSVEAPNIAPEYKNGLITPKKSNVLLNRRLNGFIWALLAGDERAISELSADIDFSRHLLNVPCDACGGSLRVAAIRQFLQSIESLQSENSGIRERIKKTIIAANLDRVSPGLYRALNDVLKLNELSNAILQVRREEHFLLKSENYLPLEIRAGFSSVGRSLVFAPHSPNIVVVLGNGPSAKLLEFDQLCSGQVATVGMNAAYRYWDQIDFRPTYYICMDTVVLQSHAEHIVALIKEGRIKKFFLRDELKETYPDLASHERIYWYSQARAESDLFRTDYVTTGSWAIRWMLREGMQLIATIGIDANYTEILTDAKRIGTGADLRLIITKTPSFNPNYFFDSYQQAGDKYNIPNDPEHLKVRGGLVHVDALRMVAQDGSRLGFDAKIIDLSPISSHGIFEKCSLDSFFRKLRISLISSFPLNQAVDVLQNNIRVATVNAANPFISKVHLLCEGARNLLDGALGKDTRSHISKLEEAGRLQIAFINQRPSYKELFDCANLQNSAYAIIANSDVVIPYATAAQIAVDRFPGGQPPCVLTRWNLTDTGLFPQGMSASPPWPQIPLEDLTYKDRNVFSFDTYVFELPIRIQAGTDQVFLGTFGCDTALAGILKVGGSDVTNPCLSYKTIHIDDKPRNYAGEKGKSDVLKNIAAFKNSVLSRYSIHSGIRESLDKLSTLNRSVAWIGGPRTIDVWHSLLRAVGATIWSTRNRSQHLRFQKIPVSRELLDSSYLEIKSLFDKLAKENIFIEWELSGFDGDVHVIDLLIANKKYNNIGASLVPYQWQSMIHVDRATAEEKSIYFDILLVIRDLLATNGLEQIVPLPLDDAKKIAAVDRQQVNVAPRDVINTVPAVSSLPKPATPVTAIHQASANAPSVQVAVSSAGVIPKPAIAESVAPLPPTTTNASSPKPVMAPTTPTLPAMPNPTTILGKPSAQPLPSTTLATSLLESGRFVVRMDKPVAGQNWHGPESDPSGQFRWTGPGARATLSLSVRRDREMLAVVAYYMPVIAEQLRGFHVQVDGVTVPHSIRADISPKCVVMRLPVRDTPDDSETELALVLPVVSFHSLPGGSPDKRLLGLAVYSVSVIPAEPALPVRFPVSRFESLRRRMRLARRDRPSGDFPLSHFDGLAYLEACPDVADAVIAGAIPSALEHYRRHGRKDGRRFTLAIGRAPNEGSMADLFDGLAYLEMYPDVADAVRSETEPTAFEHYLKYGRKDGRPIRTRFDGQVRRGTALDLVRLDATRMAKANNDELKAQLSREIAAKSDQLGSQVTKVESAVASAVHKSDLESARSEFRRAATELGALRLELGRIEQASREGVERAHAQLSREIAARSDQLGSQVTKVESAVASAVHKSDLESARSEFQRAASELGALRVELGRIEQTSREGVERAHAHLAALASTREAREQDLLFQLDALRSGSAEAQNALAAAAQADDLEQVRGQIATETAALEARERALVEQVEALKSGLAETQKELSAAAQADEAASLKLETLQNRMHKEIVAALARERALLGQVEMLKSGLAEAQQRLATAAQADEVAQVKTEIGKALALEQGLSEQVDAVRSGLAEAQQRLATAAQADEVAQVKTEIGKALALEQGLSEQVDAVRSGLAEAQQRLATAAQADEVAQVKTEIGKALALEQGLSEQVDAVRSGLAEAQQRLSTAAQADEVAQVKTEIAKSLAWERTLFGQVDAIKSGLAEAQQRLAGAARADQLEQVRKEAAAASVTREAREQALAAQVDAVKSSLANTQEGMSAVARADDLEHLKRDATRELERVRSEIANALTMREAREQAVLEQIELLRISLDESQRKLSATARADDLDRLKRDATQDLERVRSEIASTAAVESARGQALLAQIDTLKAEINSAKTRAELAEVKVASAERELGAEARQFAGSLSNLGDRIESSKSEVAKLQAELGAVKNQAASTGARVNHPNLSAFNVLGFQAHPRMLLKNDAERLATHWAPLLGLSLQEKELYYLAHRVCSMENACTGRLAASVNDILLRILVARSIKSPRLEILEIGTLFGLGVGALHEALSPLFERVQFTVIDPLEGYYGSANRDILTGVPVNRTVFEENLRRTGVSSDAVNLIQLLSTDSRALRRARKKRYDLMIIDADHTYKGVKNDAEKYVSSTKRGGYVIFDDYGNPYWPDVKKYVDAEVMPRKDLKFVGAEWHTAVFQVVGARGQIAPR